AGRRALRGRAAVTCRRDPVITIDGPAGAGKSTTAREVARRLGFRLVDTGALYRGLGWALMQAGVSPEDEIGVGALLARTTVELADSNTGGRVLVNGRDVTAEIRTPEIALTTSRLTALRAVRDKMTPLQRSLAAAGGIVLEGRDTGSVVCPDAEVKVYLDADLAERARRRRDELAARGLPADYESVKAEVALRDRQDMERELAPLRKPPGAVTVDSTALSPEAVVLRILDAVEQARCCTRS
ncbi:MAG: cytidylate kinase, partial [Candidatus Rokubacteria bacterium]|nr:cytidylate kinase [Candidatus Rokubacteria bacterium]